MTCSVQSRVHAVEQCEQAQCQTNSQCETTHHRKCCKEYCPRKKRPWLAGKPTRKTNSPRQPLGTRRRGRVRLGHVHDDECGSMLAVVGGKTSHNKEESDECQPAHEGDSGRNLSNGHGRHNQQRRHHGNVQRTPASATAPEISSIGPASVVGFATAHRCVAVDVDHHRGIPHARAPLGTCARGG